MKRGRALQLAIVATAVAGTVAYSISRHEVVARPAVVVQMVTAADGASTVIAIRDRSGGAVAIDSTSRMGACDPEIAAAPSTFVLAGNAAQPVTVSCAPLATYTMKRCQFEANDGRAAVLAYTGICVARAVAALSPSALATGFVARPGTSSTWQTIAFTTPIAMKSVSVQIDDQDDIFEVQTPCDTPSGCNDFDQPTHAGAAFDLAFACHPQDKSPHSAHAYVLGDTGAGAVVRLDCNAAGPVVGFAPGFDVPIVPDVTLSIDDAMIDGPGSGSDAPVVDAVIGMGSDAPPVDAMIDAPAMGSDAPPFDAMIDAPGMGSDAASGMSTIVVMPKTVMISAPVGGNGSADINFAEVGTGSVTINSDAITGPGAARWSISADPPCGALPCGLGAGSSTNFHVVYTPTVPAAMDTATVTFNSTDPTDPSETVTLFGTATGGPKIAAMPTTVALATQVSTLATAGVTLTNIGMGDLSISAFAVTGGNGWSAALGSACPTLPCTLPANQSVTVDLMFVPSMLGANNAVLEVDSDDPMTPQLFVPLDGTGQGATLGSTASTLDFGAPVVGSFSQRLFQLTNAGNIPADVTYSLVGAVFSIDVQPMTVPTSGAMVTLRCTPAMVTSYTGTLTVASSNALSGSPVTVDLTCAGSMASASPKLEVSPPSLMVQANVGGAPSVTMLDLSDSGAMPLVVNSIAKLGSGTWSFASVCTSGCSLAASSGSHQTIAATYTPTAIGATDVAMLQIVSTDPVTPTTVVVLTGTGLGATFAVTPSALDFGTVPIGGSSPKTLQLDNAGNVQLTGITYTPPGPPFTLDQGPTSVDVGTPATVRISCSPTAAGPASGTLTIHAPNAIPPADAVIPLTCSGQSGGLVAFPTSLDFGEIRIGDTAPRTKQVALSSTGAQLLLTSQPMLAMPVPGLTVGTVSTTITTTPAPFDVTYTPPLQDTSFATTIAATAGNTATIAVSGKVVTPAVDADATMEVNAGTWCLNQPTTPTTIALTSTGTATLHVAQPALQMNTAFALSDVMPAMAGYPFTLASGGTVSVAVQPHASATAGHVTDMLAWNADLPTPVITPIVADFVSDGGVARPSVLEFEVAVTKSDTKIVSLQNCQTLPLAFTGARITPDDVFSVDAQPPPSLLPGVVGAIAVKFTPKKVGVVTGTLTIDAPTGPLTVELHAAGLGGTGASGTPATFYGCGCRSSDPRGALFPLGLLGTVALVVRRRRSRR